MYCPTCGQQQISDETRFCSRCGFLLSGVAEVVSNGGAMPQFISKYDSKAISPRKKGIKQGGILMLSSLIIVPLVAIITVALNIEPFLVAIIAIITFWGGLLRIIYASIFESGEPIANTLEGKVDSSTKSIFGKEKKPDALPPQQSITSSDYVQPSNSNWRDTNDLVQPSVTEGTTKLLEKED